MRQLNKRKLLEFDTILCDIDGVVWREGEIVWDNVRALILLKNSGKKLIFITENRLKSIGIIPDMLITSSLATAIYLEREGIKTAFVMGEEGLRRALRDRNIVITERNPQAVVVGLDRNFNYESLKKAVNIIHRGAMFLATNMDAYIIKRGELLPGSGSLVKSISYAVGREPDVVIGKPNKYIYEPLKGKALGKVAVIGDRLETDIKGGKEFGFSTVLVLTGVHNLEDVKRLNIWPDFYAYNLYSALSND